MNKIDAFSNCLAAFHYAMWRYSDSIVLMTSNGITYSININLEHADYDSERELEHVRNVVAAGADIQCLKPISATYDIIVVYYRYED